MLDQQDVNQIRQVVREEISGTDKKVSVLETRTSKIEQSVSSLEQNASTLQQDFRHFGVLMEDQTKLIKLVLENVVQNNKHTEKVPFIEDTLANHEIRIKGLEFAKKKSA